MEKPSSWLSRPPRISGYRTHPGIRHYSRLQTKPTAFLHPQDLYPEAQIKYVKNRFNVHSQTLMHLCDGMHLFSRQLPNMGTPYISRLVYDVQAFSVFLLHGGRVSGGICSRLFSKEEFIEIVFCAVDSTYQTRGYGRLVMNYLKLYLQNIEIYDLLTCADNEAVTYFRKQGFNKHEILINPTRWVGCIKDYDGITLVHCKIRPDIDYLHFPVSLRKQQIILEQKTGVAITSNQQNPLYTMDTSTKPYKISEYSQTEIENYQYSNPIIDEDERKDSINKMQEIMKKLTPKFLAFPQAPSFVNVSIPEILDSYKPLPYLLQPQNTNIKRKNSKSASNADSNNNSDDDDVVEVNAEPNVVKKTILHPHLMNAHSKKKFIDDYNKKMETFRKKFLAILNELKSDSFFSVVFSRPVTEEIAPTYFTLIKKPMDFLTIEKRLTRFTDYYKRPEIFALDINQMCENCKKFNTPDTNYYKAAVDLMKKFKQLYDEEFPDYPLQI